MRQRSQHFDPRQTMQTDTFEVFHYRDTNPGTVEMHHHDFYELYCLLEGRVEYWVEGRVIRLQPGDILLVSDDYTNHNIYEAMYTGEDFLGSYAPGQSPALLTGVEAAAYLDSLPGRYAYAILRPSLSLQN